MAAPPVAGWQAQILKGIGAPVTPENLRYMNAWAHAEGGAASNNPFNTTQQAPGASSYNSVGVRNYVSPEQGIQATIQTLNNGRYGNILGALRKGDSAQAAAAALAASPWGTGALVQKVLGGPPAPSTPLPAPQTLAAPPTLRPPPGSAQDLALLNEGAKLFDLPPMPAMPSPAPLRQPTAGPVPPTPAPNISGIAKTALTQIGIPYQWGGQAKLGSRTDCSGLLQASARANGVNIGRTTYEQWKQGVAVPLNQLRPGDAVFFHPGPKGPEHVAIYIGNGRIVEDPHTGASVHISALAGRGPMGARRY